MSGYPSRHVQHFYNYFSCQLYFRHHICCESLPVTLPSHIVRSDYYYISRFFVSFHDILYNLAIKQYALDILRILINGKDSHVLGFQPSGGFLMTNGSPSVIPVA